jgi:hypothetical protein
VPTYPELHPIDKGINDFLADHIRDLRHLTATRQTQPGRFVDAQAQALFRSLRYDKAPDFLATVDSLLKRLIDKMDQRTKAGLLICLRASEDSNLIAGVLKLQVVAEHGAVLEKLDSGDEVLSAVTDLLDKPGDLQKGTLVMSTLPEGQLLTGDRLASQDAIYFPRPSASNSMPDLRSQSASCSTLSKLRHRNSWRRWPLRCPQFLRAIRRMCCRNWETAFPRWTAAARPTWCSGWSI